MRLTSALFVVALSVVPASAQTFNPNYPAPQSHLSAVPRAIDLSGPRFGFTLLSPGVIEKLEARNIFVEPMISQFGWQLERQFHTRGSGVTAVSEWVFLLGGLDQSVALPSVSWLVGLRTKDGAEFGIGPNITPAGAALAIAGGITFRAGSLNVPMNFAIVPSKAGPRVSVLTGFNFRRR